MYRPFINNVCLASEYTPAKSGRFGTAFLTLEAMGRKFGDPHVQDFSEDGVDGAGKVHAIWTIDTPRGIAEVRDYWWNPKDQLSIGADNKWAFLWAKNWLRCMGVRVSDSNGKEVRK